MYFLALPPAVPSLAVEESTEPASVPPSHPSNWPPPLSQVAIDAVDLGETAPEASSLLSSVAALLLKAGFGGCWCVGLGLAALLGGSGGGFLGLLSAADVVTAGAAGFTATATPVSPRLGADDTAVSGPPAVVDGNGASSSSSSFRWLSSAKGFRVDEAVTNGFVVGLVGLSDSSSANGLRLAPVVVPPLGGGRGGGGVATRLLHRRRRRRRRRHRRHRRHRPFHHQVC